METHIHNDPATRFAAEYIDVQNFKRKAHEPVFDRFQPFADIPTGASVTHPGYLDANWVDTTFAMRQRATNVLRLSTPREEWTDAEWLAQAALPPVHPVIPTHEPPATFRSRYMYTPAEPSRVPRTVTRPKPATSFL